MWISDASQVNVLISLKNKFKMLHAQLKFIRRNLGGQLPILKCACITIPILPKLCNKH